MRHTSRLSVVAALAAVFSMLFANLAFASELTVATLELDATDVQADVDMEPGDELDFKIKATITGKQDNPASFKVNTTFTLTDGSWAASAPTTVSVPPRTNGAAATVIYVDASVLVTDPHDDGGPYLVPVAVFDLVTTSGGALAFKTSNLDSFNVTVENPAVLNTKPTVAVTGVTNGASYEFGSVPTAGCNITDTEDGNSVKSATLSAITGTHASSGLGSRTATCTHTDSGGLSADAVSVTYSIVDTTAPVLSNVPADITGEATSAAGRTVTYSSPTATDAVDATPSVSCVPASGATFAIGETVVTCTATDFSNRTSAASTFKVTIVDTTAPALSNMPGNITQEATGANGATVSWMLPTATDLVDGAVASTCASQGGLKAGDTFPLGTTTVTCTATDTRTNTSPGLSFSVTVLDTTDPVLTVPATAITAEATGANGALVNFTTSATDAVDATPTIVCTPASGTRFAIGTTQVSCTATDDAGNISDPQVFDVTVQDTTDPVATIAIDGNDWTNNRNVTVDLAATDAVGVTGYRLAESQSGLTGAFTAIDPADDDYALNNLAVELSDADAADKGVWVEFTDAAGNTSTASDSVGLDRVGPVVLNEDDEDANYTRSGWTNAASVSHTFDVSDALSGLPAGTAASFTLTVSAESTKDSAGNVVAGTDSGTVSDRAGNSTTRTFSARIDRTNPVNQISGPADGGTYTLGSTIPAAVCSTGDALSGTATTATASAVDNATVGSKTVTCSGGTDNAGNTAASVSRTYSVLYNWTGFFQPIDNNNVFNKAKAGSAIPVKFSLSGNRGMGIIDTIGARRVACPSTMVADALETTAADTTSGLKYDATADQYNYTWKTGTVLAGTCQRLELKLMDGTLHTANFTFTK